MRIPCPYCGPRDVAEFSYLGDAAPARPDPASPDAASAFHDYVYLRENPAGAITDLWYHGGGCRSWIRVSRDTRTHAVDGASLAAEAAR